MTPITVVYLLYLALSLLITVRVGHMLHRHGRLFLVDVFCGNGRRADAVNHLLLVGYYLTNIALVLFLLRSQLAVSDWLDGAHLLSHKLGIVMTTLGTMHFFNFFVLLQVRRYVRRSNPAWSSD
jgi:hypothetical protein